MIYGMGDPVRSLSGWETVSGEFYLVGIEGAWEGKGYWVGEKERRTERERKKERGKREAEAISSEE